MPQARPAKDKDAELSPTQAPKTTTLAPRTTTLASKTTARTGKSTTQDGSDPVARPGKKTAWASTDRTSADRGSTDTERTGQSRPIADEMPARPSRQARVRKASLRMQPMPAPLRGSYESLVRQNEKTLNDGLERIDNDQELADLIRRKQLVPVPASSGLTVNGNLSENRRYCRPWTATFLSDLARAHQMRFHSAFEVSSAVRTVEYQKRLSRTNGNAAAAEGDVVSPHLTGSTIDIAKQGMSRQELGWMRSWLLPLQQAGKLDVEEEFQQACFHITVYKSYAPPKPVKIGPQNMADPSTAKRKNGQPAADPGKTPKAIEVGPAGDTAAGGE
jgi:hypothetical protein